MGGWPDAPALRVVSQAFGWRVSSGPKRSGGWRGGLPGAPLLAEDHVLVNFNFHTVEKHTVQATRGIHCTAKLANTPQHARAPPATLGAVLRAGGPMQNGTGETSRLSPCTPPPRGFLCPQPHGHLQEDKRPSRRCQTLCSWPVSFPPGKVNPITSHRAWLGSQGHPLGACSGPGPHT